MDNKEFSAIRKNGLLPDPRRVDPSGMISDLWEVYYDSSLSLLNKIERAAMAIEAGKNTDENAAVIRRLLHSLKGDSGVTGLTDIYYLCHEVEFGFEELPLSEGTDMILKVKDWIFEAIACIKNGETIVGPAESADDEKKHMIKTLAVDDQPVVRKHIEILLRDFCDCTFAVDGSEACELFAKAIEDGTPFELVTLDIEMPIMNGHETLAMIRDIEKEHGIRGLDGVKVVMSTSLEDSQHIFSAFKEGCEAYVKKIDMEKKLVEEIEKLGIKVPQSV
jgi:CheY-like chemotaxis protein